jgi:glycerophosphoryl diester phosphodiesterase
MVAAHRGFAAGAAENTVAAFTSAIDVGADMIEFDVRRTRDGELIAFHDPTVGGTPVSGLSLDDIAAVAGVRPPLLADVLRTCAGKIRLDVELKEDGYVPEVMAALRAGFDPAQMIVTSFLPAVVAQAKDAFPGLRTGLLLGSGWADLPTRLRELYPVALARQVRADYLAPHYRLAALGVVRRAAAAGLPCLLWTVNSPGLIRKYAGDERVAAIITDMAAQAVSIVSGASRLARGQELAHHADDLVAAVRQQRQVVAAGQLRPLRAGYAVEQLLRQLGRRDAVRVAVHDQRALGNLRQPAGHVEPADRLELGLNRGPGLRVVAAQQRQPGQRHAQPDPPAARARPGPGGHQHQVVHQVRVVKRERQRDPAAHRDAEYVGAGQAELGGKPGQVGGHLLDGVRAGGPGRPARTAVVGRDHPVAGRGEGLDQRLDLRHGQPEAADEQQRGAGAVHLVVQLDAVGGQLRHAGPLRWTAGPAVTRAASESPSAVPCHQDDDRRLALSTSGCHLGWAGAPGFAAAVRDRDRLRPRPGR